MWAIVQYRETTCRKRKLDARDASVIDDAYDGEWQPRYIIARADFDVSMFSHPGAPWRPSGPPCNRQRSTAHAAHALECLNDIQEGIPGGVTIAT